MKKNITYTFVILLCMISYVVQAQRTTIDPYVPYTLTKSFYIEDPSYPPGIGSYTYYAAVRIETTGGFTSDYNILGTYYVANTSYTIASSQFFNVPYPSPLPDNYYSIRITIRRDYTNGPTVYRGNTSVAGLIYSFPKYYLDPDTDPIVVKF